MIPEGSSVNHQKPSRLSEYLSGRRLCYLLMQFILVFYLFFLIYEATIRQIETTLNNSTLRPFPLHQRQGESDDPSFAWQVIP